MDADQLIERSPNVEEGFALGPACTTHDSVSLTSLYSCGWDGKRIRSSRSYFKIHTGLSPDLVYNILSKPHSISPH